MDRAILGQKKTGSGEQKCTCALDSKAVQILVGLLVWPLCPSTWARAVLGPRGCWHPWHSWPGLCSSLIFSGAVAPVQVSLLSFYLLLL